MSENQWYTLASFQDAHGVPCLIVLDTGPTQDDVNDELTNMLLASPDWLHSMPDEEGMVVIPLSSVITFMTVDQSTYDSMQEGSQPVVLTNEQPQSEQLGSQFTLPNYKHPEDLTPEEPRSTKGSGFRYPEGFDF